MGFDDLLTASEIALVEKWFDQNPLEMKLRRKDALTTNLLDCGDVENRQLQNLLYKHSFVRTDNKCIFALSHNKSDSLIPGAMASVKKARQVAPSQSVECCFVKVIFGLNQDSPDVQSFDDSSQPALMTSTPNAVTRQPVQNLAFSYNRGDPDTIIWRGKFKRSGVIPTIKSMTNERATLFRFGMDLGMAKTSDGHRFFKLYLFQPQGPVDASILDPPLDTIMPNRTISRPHDRDITMFHNRHIRRHPELVLRFEETYGKASCRLQLNDQDRDRHVDSCSVRQYRYYEPQWTECELSLSQKNNRIRLFISMLECLDSLHRQGIVHGDIKQTNVLVDPSGHATLIDFGAAGQIGDKASARVWNRLAISPKRLSQRNGSHTITAEDDIYGINKLLTELGIHECLTDDERKFFFQSFKNNDLRGVIRTLQTVTDKYDEQAVVKQAAKTQAKNFCNKLSDMAKTAVSDLISEPEGISQFPVSLQDLLRNQCKIVHDVASTAFDYLSKELKRLDAIPNDDPIEGYRKNLNQLEDVESILKHVVSVCGATKAQIQALCQVSTENDTDDVNDKLGPLLPITIDIDHEIQTQFSNPSDGRGAAEEPSSDCQDCFTRMAVGCMITERTRDDIQFTTDWLHLYFELKSLLDWANLGDFTCERWSRIDNLKEQSQKGKNNLSRIDGKLPLQGDLTEMKKMIDVLKKLRMEAETYLIGMFVSKFSSITRSNPEQAITTALRNSESLDSLLKIPRRYLETGHAVVLKTLMQQLNLNVVRSQPDAVAAGGAAMGEGVAEEPPAVAEQTAIGDGVAEKPPAAGDVAMPEGKLSRRIRNINDAVNQIVAHIAADITNDRSNDHQTFNRQVATLSKQLCTAIAANDSGLIAYHRTFFPTLRPATHWGANAEIAMNKQMGTLREEFRSKKKNPNEDLEGLKDQITQRILNINIGITGPYTINEEIVRLKSKLNVSSSGPSGSSLPGSSTSVFSHHH